MLDSSSAARERLTVRLSTAIKGAKRDDKGVTKERARMEQAKDEEIEGLRNQLEASKDAMAKELEEYKEGRREAEDENSLLMQRLDAMVSELSLIEAAKDATERELKAEVKGCKKERTAIEEERREEIKELRGRLEARDSCIKELRGNAAVLRSMFDSANAERGDLAMRLSLINKCNEELMAKNERLTADLDTANYDHAAMEEEHEKIISNLERMESDKENLSRELTMFESRYEELQVECHGLRSRMSESDAKNDCFEMQLENATAEVVSDFELMESDKESLLCELTMLESRYEELQVECHALRSRMSESDAKNDRLETQLEKAMADCGSLGLDRNTICKRERTTRENENLSRELSDVKDKYKELLRDHAKMNSDLYSSKSKCKVLENGLEETDASFAALKDEYRAWLAELETVLERVMAEREALSFELASAMARDEDQRSDNEDLWYCVGQHKRQMKAAADNLMPQMQETASTSGSNDYSDELEYLVRGTKDIMRGELKHREDLISDPIMQ